MKSVWTSELGVVPLGDVSRSERGLIVLDRFAFVEFTTVRILPRKPILETSHFNSGRYNANE